MRRLLLVLPFLVAATCHRSPDPLIAPAPLDPAPGFPTAPLPVPERYEDAVAEMVDNFRRVHFPLDSASLDAASMAVLTRNADIMRRYRDLEVEVQGHADERGTVDYNLALGHRRARAVADHMIRMGVAPTRIMVISFGEEVPAARGHDEVAWAENRRAEFRVLAGRGVGGTLPAGTR